MSSAFGISANLSVFVAAGCAPPLVPLLPLHATANAARITNTLFFITAPLRLSSPVARAPDPSGRSGEPQRRRGADGKPGRRGFAAARGAARGRSARRALRPPPIRGRPPDSRRPPPPTR